MIKYLFLLLSLTCSIALEANISNLTPIKLDDHEVVYKNGFPHLLSQKNNYVSLIGIDNKIVNNKSSFSFTIQNSSNNTINFMFYNIQVLDQNYRPLKIVHKSELIKNAKDSSWWKRLASGVALACDSINAANAGRIDYQTNSYHSGSGNFSTYGSHYNSGSFTHSGNTYTSGTIYNHAAAKQAQDLSVMKAQLREAKISIDEENRILGYLNYYFDSNTIFPGGTYSANFQIEIPDYLNERLEYLYFIFNLEGEYHVFCYHCRPSQSRSWWPF